MVGLYKINVLSLQAHLEKNRWCINIAFIQLIKTDIICFETLIHIISRSASSCYFSISIDLFWDPVSQRKLECLHFNFLSVSWENKKLKTITSYFRGPSNSRSFIKIKKNAFLGTIAILFMKIKTASVHTGVGNHREMKSKIKTCLPWWASARGTSSFKIKKM